MSKKELIGYCGVDSGQLLIVDPCYLHDWKHGEYDDLDSSYREVCDVTLGPKQAGSAFNDMGVALSTGYGDGNYPIFIKRNSEGRIIQVIIDFN
jgi:hypothetical protein